MSTEQNKAIIRRYFDEVWNRGNLAILDELMDQEYVAYAKRFVPMWRRAIPDAIATIDPIVAEGDRVAVGLTSRGTHTGVLKGELLPPWLPQPIAPTGNRVEYRGVFFYSVTAGKIQRQGHWGVMDWLTLLRQLEIDITFDVTASRS